MMPDTETFSPDEIKGAIAAFLRWGEEEYGKSQGGYLSGNGWAARCLRYHLTELENTERLPARSGSASG